MGFRLLKKKKSSKSGGKSKEGNQGTSKRISKKKERKVSEVVPTILELQEVEEKKEVEETEATQCCIIQDEAITNSIAHEASIEISAHSNSINEITLEESKQDDDNEDDEEEDSRRQRLLQRRENFTTHEDSSIDLIATPIDEEEEDSSSDGDKHNSTTCMEDECNDMYYMEEEWEQIKQPLEEIVLEVEFPSCASLSTFVDTFIADDAQYSIEKYQQQVIGDKDVEYSKWRNSSTNIEKRNINFIHPLKNKVGPTQAKTNRQQQLTKFCKYGRLCLQNTTRVQGVPGADCFRGEDKWILEQHQQGSSNSSNTMIIRMTVSYRLVFEKRCMVQKIIQKNYRRETKEWYEGYAKYVKDSLVESGLLLLKQEQPPKEGKMHVVVDQQTNNNDKHSTNDHHHHNLMQVIQKVHSTSDDTAATIQSSCTGSFDSTSTTTEGNDDNDNDNDDDDDRIANLTKQIDELKDINARQAKRIDELERKLLLSSQQQQQQQQQQTESQVQDQDQQQQEKKLFTGYYLKQLQDHHHQQQQHHQQHQQQEKKLFTGYYLKQMQQRLDEHGRDSTPTNHHHVWKVQ